MSFATFVYDRDGIEKIDNLLADKLIGFDAGDAIRSATVLSPSFSTFLKQSNSFRIDGKYYVDRSLHGHGLTILLSCMNSFLASIFPLSIGHCITTAYPGDVCGLDSYAVGCEQKSAISCRCYQDDSTGHGVSDLASNNTFTLEPSPELPTQSICEGVHTLFKQRLRIKHWYFFSP